jgi:DUF1680 family protein
VVRSEVMTTTLVPVAVAKPVETDIDELKTHVKSLRKAKADLKELAAYIKVLEDKIQETLEKRNATDGKINNAVVVTWRPTATYRYAEFAKTYPDIHARYMEPEVVDVLNKARLAAEHPALLEPFRTRALLLK